MTKRENDGTYRGMGTTDGKERQKRNTDDENEEDEEMLNKRDVIDGDSEESRKEKRQTIDYEGLPETLGRLVQFSLRATNISGFPIYTTHA